MKRPDTVNGDGDILRIALLDAMELIRVLRTDLPFDGCNNADEQMDFMIDKWAKLLTKPALPVVGGQAKTEAEEALIGWILDEESRGESPWPECFCCDDGVAFKGICGFCAIKGVRAERAPHASAEGEKREG